VPGPELAGGEVVAKSLASGLSSELDFDLSFSAVILRITAVGVKESGLEEEACCCFVDD